MGTPKRSAREKVAGLACCLSMLNVGQSGARTSYNPIMSVDELEAEILKLDPQNRARLAEKLLASLEDLSEEESARLWAEEAARRDIQWDRSGDEGKPAADVFQAARARLK